MHVAIASADAVSSGTAYDNWPRGYKLEYSLKLKIKRNDWPLVETSPQEANRCALF